MEGSDQFICVEDLETLLNVAKYYCNYCNTEAESVKSCAGEKRFGCPTTICNNCFSAIFRQARVEDFVCGACPVPAAGSRGRHTADTDFSKDVHSPTLVRTLQADKKNKKNKAIHTDAYNMQASQLESMTNNYQVLYTHCEKLVEYHAQEQQAKELQVVQLQEQVAQLQAQVAQLQQ